MNTKVLAAEFRARLEEGIQHSRQLGYDASRVAQMLASGDAVSVAKKLVVSAPIVPGGPKVMAKLGRTDLTIESIMCEERFRPLFSESELAAAKFRLDQL
jgi:hypothetical protein